MHRLIHVVILSDTHFRQYHNLNTNLRADIAKADVVIHAGDIGTDNFFIDLKNASKRLIAINGNNDYFDLPDKVIEDIGGVKIAMIHSHQASFDSRVNYLLYNFANEKPDMIVFGHTHKPEYLLRNDLDKKTAILNPGSPTNNRGLTYNSYVNMKIYPTGSDESSSRNIANDGDLFAVNLANNIPTVIEFIKINKV